MNERIKELNHQALSIVMNGDDPDGDVERMYIPSEFTKKFAELIVKECTSIALEQKKWVEDMVVLLPQHVEFNRVRIQQSQRIVDKIKEHFGVEE